MFNVDGYAFNFPCSIERSVKIESSSNSGLLLSKKYFNDVIASYLSYTVKVAVPQGKESDYSRLFSILSEPKAEHYWVFPYNQTTISFNGKVDSVSDKYFRQINGKNIWRDISFTVTATEPKEEPIISWLIYEYYTNVTSNIDRNFALDGQRVTFTITPDEGYTITSVQVLLGTDDVTSSAYNSETHEISLVVTDDVTITAVAEVIE